MSRFASVYNLNRTHKTTSYTNYVTPIKFRGHVISTKISNVLYSSDSLEQVFVFQHYACITLMGIVEVKKNYQLSLFSGYYKYIENKLQLFYAHAYRDGSRSLSLLELVMKKSWCIHPRINQLFHAVSCLSLNIATKPRSRTV